MARKDHIIKAVKGQLDTPKMSFSRGQENPKMILTLEACTPSQLRNILKNIAPGCPAEDIVVIVDASNGKGTQGLAFTEYGLYASKNMLKATGLFAKPIPMPIRYEDFIKLEKHTSDSGTYDTYSLLLPQQDGRRIPLSTGSYTQFIYELRRHMNWAMTDIRKEEEAQKTREIAQGAGEIIAQGDQLAAAGDLAGAVRCFAQAAQMGDSEGMYRYGQLYEEGRGVQQDLKTAFQWYLDASKKKHPGANIKLGEMLIEGRGVEADPLEGKWHYRFAATAGDPEGLYRLGMLTYPDPGFEDLGLSYLEKAAGKGHTKAAEKAKQLREDQNRILAQAAAYYQAGDYRKAADCLEPLVNRGVAQAEYQYGYLHWTGKGVPKSDEAAFQLFECAANNGHAPAMVACGQCYMSGTGVEEDRGAAHEMMRKAAELGNLRAELSLKNDNIFDPHTIFVIH